jgi:hypothetical protein
MNVRRPRAGMRKLPPVELLDPPEIGGRSPQHPEDSRALVYGGRSPAGARRKNGAAPKSASSLRQLACNNCDASYVGQSKRQLKTRIKEHRNNIKLAPDKHSVVSDHIINCDHTFDWDHASILDKETNYHKRLVSEMIHIREQNNSINLMKDTELLDKSYLSILETLR